MLVLTRVYALFLVWVLFLVVFFSPGAYVYEWLVMADVMPPKHLPRWLAPLAAVLAWPLWIRMAICSGIIVGAWLLFLTQVCHLDLPSSLAIIGSIFGFHFLLVALFVGVRKVRMRFGLWQERRRHAREARPAAESSPT